MIREKNLNEILENSSIDVFVRIFNGSHPCCHSEQFTDPKTLEYL